LDALGGSKDLKEFYSYEVEFDKNLTDLRQQAGIGKQLGIQSKNHRKNIIRTRYGLIKVNKAPSLVSWGWAA
jgi:hypothetical protein